MSSEEFQELVAYAKCYGIPNPVREAALICAVIANTQRTKGQKPATPADFMPQPPRRPIPLDQAEKMIKAQLRQRGTL